MEMARQKLLRKCDFFHGKESRFSTRLMYEPVAENQFTVVCLQYVVHYLAQARY